MKKVQYDHLPPKLEAVNNGSHFYRWGIEETTNPENEQPIWECFEVLVWNEPNREKVITTVINELWPSQLESKLQNDYNAAKIGLLPDTAKQAYIDFINERNAIKDEINTYFDFVDAEQALYKAFVALGWHQPPFAKRIIAPVQLVMQYPAIEAWFRINDLPIIRVESTLYCYCNVILPEHQQLVDALQGIVSIENRPIL
jgi:hypothetical protein